MIEKLEKETKEYEEKHGITDGADRRREAVKKARAEMYGKENIKDLSDDTKAE